MGPLFSIPSDATVVESGHELPAGGLGGGQLGFGFDGGFRGWRIQPGLPERDQDVPADRFHLWTRSRRAVRACTLALDPNPRYAWPESDGIVPAGRQLFPFT